MTRPDNQLSGGFGLTGTTILVCRLVALLTVVFLAFPRESCAAITALSYDASGNEISQQTATPAAPVILGSAPSQVVGSGGIGGFSVNVASPLPVTYQWYFNGDAIPGATGDSLLLPTVTSAQDGNYTVTVTNSSGSVTSSPYKLGFDNNGNGLPDAWELAAFGNLTQTAGGDYDGDSITNLDEYFGNTNPTVRDVYYWIAASGDFNTASNWNRNRVPGPGDTAVINTGTFTVPANTIAVSQVTVNAPFTVPSGADYTLNIAGNWSFNGIFTLATGRQFAVTGGGSAAVAGTTNLNGANLLVDNGATLSFPNVTSYAVPAGLSVQWAAYHAGTVLRFPNLTMISGPTTPGRYFDLRSERYEGDIASTLSLPALTTITKTSDGDGGNNSGVRFFAGASGMISAPNLSSFQDNDPYPDSSLNASSNGVLALPQLLAPKGVNLDLNALSHPEQFTSLVGTRSLRISGAGTMVMSNLTSIQGISSITIDEAQVSFPNVTSYAVPADSSVQWAAYHAGTVLSFPNLTMISGPTTPGRYFDLRSERYEGDIASTLSLPALTTITKSSDGDGGNNSGVRFFASASGVISAPNLSSFQDNDPYPDSSLNASSEGVLALPQLLAPKGVNLDLNALSHPEQFTSLVGTRSLRISGAGTVVMSNLTSIQGISFITIDHGAQVSFPNVTSYAVPAGLSVQWAAYHAGTVLSFPNLTMISGPTTPGRYFDLRSERYEGDIASTLSLPALTTITKTSDGDGSNNSGVRFFASASGVISAPNLSSFQDNDPYPDSSLNASSNGVLALPNLTAPKGVNINLNAQSNPQHFTASSGVSFDSATLSAVINRNVLPAAVRFEYGLTTAYGSSTAVQNITTASVSPVQAVLSGLVAGTLYHYRVVVTASSGTTASNDQTFRTTSGLVSDFNLDGKTDLVWRHDSGAICVWFMDGINILSGTFFNPAQTDPSWKISAVGDFNQDGKPDLIWRHTSGVICVWYMDGINLLSSAYLNPSQVNPTWKIAGVGDFNQDGKPDLVWRHDGGTIGVWFMDGINLLSGPVFNPSKTDPSWKISGVGDFNQDGKPDLVWRQDSGLVGVWFMDGINLLSGTLFNPGQTDPSWKVSGVGDFNLDGKPDLVWRHDSGALYVWFMNGINFLAGSFFNPSQVDPSWKNPSP